MQEKADIPPLCINCNINLAGKLFSGGQWTGDYDSECINCRKNSRIRQHHKRNNERLTRLREKYNKEGLCNNCGDVRHLEYKLCFLCWEDKLKRHKRRREQAMSEGLCYTCKKVETLSNRGVCFDCNLRSRSSNILGTSLRWNELKNLWDKQNGMCPYTGLKLNLLDAHLDHIIPLSKGGSSEIDNLEFTSKDVNQMKRNHYVEDFLNIVEIIYLYRIKNK